LLYSLGLPVPIDLEGKPTMSVFDPSVVAAHPVCMGAPTLSSEAPRRELKQPSLEADGETQVLERLRALGYLE